MNHILSRFLCLIFSAAVFALLGGCAYHVGLTDRSLPGGYKQVSVPIFKNRTEDVGIEAEFTNAMIRRLNRSQAAQVTNKETAPLVMEGTILQIETKRGAGVAGQGTNFSVKSEIPRLPKDSVLISEYRLVVSANIRLRRKSDDKIIWESNFSNERVYSAPRIGTPIVNSANALYNHSARVDTISMLAEEMMAEAHDRMTENF